MENKAMLSISGLLKKSFDFYKDKIYIILTLALIPCANYVITSLLFDGIGNQINNKGFAFGLGLLAVLFALFAILINLWVQIALFYAIKEKDVKTDAKSLLVFSWNKIYSYSWIAFLMAIIVVAGCIVFIIPGILFMMWFSLALYVFVFEDIKGMQALYRSKELVKGHWWKVFARFFLFGLIVGLVGAIPVIGDMINIFVTMPLGVVYGYFIYEDLKTLNHEMPA